MLTKVAGILGEDFDKLVSYQSTTFKDAIFHYPNKSIIKTHFVDSDRNTNVLNNLNSLYNHGRLSDTGYLSILPIDQGIEHSAAGSFSKNPIYFDPENIIKLAIEGGCSAVTSSLGVLGNLSRKYAWQIPFIVKLNHNELLSYPNKFEQMLFGQVEQAYQMGARGVGATIFFGQSDTKSKIQEVSQAFAKAHQLGLFTILWAYLRNDGFKISQNENLELSADLQGQGAYLGASIEADIIKQKIPKFSNGFSKLNTQESPYGKINNDVYDKFLPNQNPIDLVKYQLANCFLGKVPLISSGDASTDNDLKEALTSAIINKKAGGSGMIMGRKAFQKPMQEGIEILNLVQDIYLDTTITP
jgi:fructose-bisphosphate aldolase, class I